MANRIKGTQQRGYDGVVYTPGTAANRPKTNKTPERTTHKVGAARRKKPQKSQIGVFLAATLFTGVMVCIIVFALVFGPLMNGRSDSNNSPPQTQTAGTEGPLPGAVPVVSEKVHNTTGLVLSAGSSGRLSIYDYNTNDNITLAADSLSVLNNKYGEPIVFAEIKAGDIVDVEYTGDTINKLFFSPQATYYEKRSNVIIDTATQTIEVGTEVFSYNDRLIARSKNDELNLLSIKPIDEVSIRFYKNIVWYVELSRGHGQIEFAGKDNIKEGIIEIDNNSLIQNLDETKSIEVSEGMHKIVIKGKNIEPIIRDIYVERFKTEIVDLSDIEIMQGILTVAVNATDYTVKIGGEAVDLTLPIELPHGTYTVVVEKDGYFPWEGTATIAGPTNTITATLSEKIQICKFEIESIPSGAEIYIDGSFVGITPLSTSLEYGEHSLYYKKEGYKTIQPFSITLNSPKLESPYVIMLQEENPFMPEG